MIQYEMIGADANMGAMLGVDSVDELTMGWTAMGGGSLFLQDQEAVQCLSRVKRLEDV